MSSNTFTPHKIIHVIPAHSPQNDAKSDATHPRRHRRLRVAAYARVSTASEEQQNSFANQVNYYTSYIKNHKSWHFCGVYSDEGLSGLSTKSRKGFNQMLQAAEAGQIDLIITKSISRFARNMLDAISTVRHLKALGVDVFFERENIHTLDGKSEFLLSILSSLAQEESRSISENITWGLRKNMAKGKVVFHYKNFLGYRKGPDGNPEIVEAEAKIVRRIFTEFLNGAAIRDIARDLARDQIPTPRGGDFHWGPSVVASILRNEKYKGDALLQKVYTVDFLSHTIVKNTGQHPQYYIEHNHPAIISAEVYALAQAEFQRRAGSYNRQKVASSVQQHYQIHQNGQLLVSPKLSNRAIIDETTCGGI